MIYLQLLYEFFLTGLFTIGGGLAAIPLLQEMSVRTGWFTGAQLADMIAISESTPGPIGINMATYVGYATAGYWGGVVASLALVLPPLVIATVVSRLLNRFKGNELMESAFYGFRPASIGLIASAGLNVLRLSLVNEQLWKQSGIFSDLFDLKAIAFAAVLFCLMKLFKKAHPIIFIAGSAAVGIVFKL